MRERDTKSHIQWRNSKCIGEQTLPEHCTLIPQQGESKLLAYFYMRINFCLGQTVCQWEDEMIVLLWYVWVVYDTVITSPNAPWEEDAQRHVRVPSSQKQGLSVHNKRDKISSIHTPYPPRTPTVLQPGLTALHCHLLFKSFIYFCLMWMSMLHACRHA